MTPPKRQALGRGLSALIPGAGTPATASPANPSPGSTRGDGMLLVGIEEIRPGPYQPRKHFDATALSELAESIRAQGIIQPLVVRPRPAGGFELIAGERRWRAAQKAGLHQVPVVIRDVAEARAFEMALVENLQRADLNPLEEAEGYCRLMDEFDYTQESLAERVGKERSTVANALRLLKLPPVVRDFVREGRLQMGHARALLGLEDAAAIERLARATMAKSLSVRQVEEMVRRDRRGPPPQPGTEAAPAIGRPAVSANAKDLANKLQRSLGVRVKVNVTGAASGSVELSYSSLDELDRLIAKLTM